MVIRNLFLNHYFMNSFYLIIYLFFNFCAVGFMAKSQEQNQKNCWWVRNMMELFSSEKAKVHQVKNLFSWVCVIYPNNLASFLAFGFTCLDFRSLLLDNSFNYSPKWRWKLVNMKISTTFNDAEVDNCFSIFHTDTKKFVIFFWCTEKWLEIVHFWHMILSHWLLRGGQYLLFTFELANWHAQNAIHLCDI